MLACLYAWVHFLSQGASCTRFGWHCVSCFTFFGHLMVVGVEARLSLDPTVLTTCSTFCLLSVVVITVKLKECCTLGYHMFWTKQISRYCFKIQWGICYSCGSDDLTPFPWMTQYVCSHWYAWFLSGFREIPLVVFFLRCFWFFQRFSSPREENAKILVFFVEICLLLLTEFMVVLLE